MAYWKPPPVDTDTLLPGKRGASVIWLRQRVDLALRKTGGSGLVNINNPEYDNALVSGVRAFQAGTGLRPDGVAGRDTLMALNSYLDQEAVPTL